MFSNEVIWSFSFGFFAGAFAMNKNFRDSVMRLIRKPKQTQEIAPTQKPVIDVKGDYEIIEETTVTRKYQPRPRA